MRSFKVGKVLNKLHSFPQTVPKPVYRALSILYPSRLNAMAIDPSKIAIRDDHKYSPGEVLFAIKLFKEVKLSLRADGEIRIAPNTKRKPLVRHAAELMRKALKVKHGFNIEVVNNYEIKHCGLGSSSGLIAAVACAINELYGCPITNVDLVQYLAQNHGEEIDYNESELEIVQCIGGSAAAGLSPAGMIVLSGLSRFVATMRIPDTYSVLIGIPKDFKAHDAQYLMTAERKNLHKFIATGKRYGPKIAYRILHEMFPGMVEGNLRPAGDIIYDYRFNMGSIKNCQFVYRGLIKKANALAPLYTKGVVDVLALSSVGPAFFAITTRPTQAREVFEQAGLEVLQTSIHNDGYIVKKKIRI